MSMPNKKTFRVPHQLIILIVIAAIATLATYVVSAGTYDMIEVNGRKAVDPNSFHYIEQTPVGIWDAILALPGGFTKAVCLSLSVLPLITVRSKSSPFCDSSKAAAENAPQEYPLTGNSCGARNRK